MLGASTSTRPGKAFQGGSVAPHEGAVMKFADRYGVVVEQQRLHGHRHTEVSAKLQWLSQDLHEAGISGWLPDSRLSMVADDQRGLQLDYRHVAVSSQQCIHSALDSLTVCL